MPYSSDTWNILKGHSQRDWEQLVNNVFCHMFSAKSLTEKLLLKVEL